MAQFLHNFLLWTASISIAFMNPAVAAERRVYSGDVAAKYTKQFIGHHSSVGRFLKGVESQIDKKSMANLRRSLSSMGITEKSKIPAVKVDGNKIYFDKNNYLIYEDSKTININGTKFTKANESVDVVFNKIFKKLSSKNASHFEIIPEAHAFPWLIAVLALVGGVGLGALLFKKKAPPAPRAEVEPASTENIEDYTPGEIYLNAEAPKVDNNVHCYDKGYIIRENRDGRFISNKMVAVPLEAIQRACADPQKRCSKPVLERVKQAVLNPTWKSSMECGASSMSSFTVKTPPADLQIASDETAAADEPVVEAPAVEDTPVVDEGQYTPPADDLPTLED